MGPGCESFPFRPLLFLRVSGGSWRRGPRSHGTWCIARRSAQPRCPPWANEIGYQPLARRTHPLPFNGKGGPAMGLLYGTSGGCRFRGTTGHPESRENLRRILRREQTEDGAQDVGGVRGMRRGGDHPTLLADYLRWSFFTIVVAHVT